MANAFMSHRCLIWVVEAGRRSVASGDSDPLLKTSHYKDDAWQFSGVNHGLGRIVTMRGVLSGAQIYV